MLTKQEKLIILSRIKADKESIQKKIQYHERQIEKYQKPGWQSLEWSKKRLYHRQVIGELLNQRDALDAERRHILFGE